MNVDLHSFSPPKRRIFETSIKLFAGGAYELVTMADIASALGRRKPSIYNHFSSKQEILDTMYAFFVEHVFARRKTLEQLKPIIQTGSILDLILALSFQFEEEYASIMTDILSIIHQRKYFDDQARKIALEILYDEGLQYIENAFDSAIALGRLAPFNTRWISHVLLDTRNGEYLRSVLDPNHDRTEYILTQEMPIYERAIAMITDLKPPVREPDKDTANENRAQV